MTDAAASGAPARHPSVARVLQAATERGLRIEIRQFPEGTRTAEDAARAVGCSVGQIVKSLVFVAGDRAALVLVPGDRRVDAAKVGAALGGEPARIASPAEVRVLTGFEPGAVAPFPLSRVERIFVEPGLLAHERVWVGAGSERHMAGLPPTELVRLARAEPRSLVLDD